MLRRLRVLPLGFIVAAASLTATATAHADVVSTPSCDQPVSQPFLQFGDDSWYTLVPGGDFSDAAQGWSLKNGSAVVAGGDGFSLNGADPSANSLSLPDGSSATSAPMCFDIADRTLRFFAENSGSSSSTLQVTASVTTASGLTLGLPVATLTAGDSWAPTETVLTAWNYTALSSLNPTTVKFTFTPLGHGGAWQIDDVYVDPYSRT